MTNSDASISDIKNQAREQAKLVRQKIHGNSDTSVYLSLSDNIRKLLGEVCQGGQVVAGFWPLGSEIDVKIALADISRLGHTLCLPAIEGKDQPLVFRQFEITDELCKGIFGTKEPSPKAPKVTPTIILVPLLAFDQAGHRLGYGGGFYDRSIEKLLAEGEVTTIGVAFSEQQVREVPKAEHDVCLDYIITERGLAGGCKHQQKL